MVGGLEHDWIMTFHFIYGIILQFDSYFSEGLLKPPTSMDYNNWIGESL